MITKIAMMRKNIRKPICMRMFPYSVVMFSSVGRAWKVSTDSRRLSSDSSVIVEEKKSRLLWFWKEFVEDKVRFCVELGYEYSWVVCET